MDLSSSNEVVLFLAKVRSLEYKGGGGFFLQLPKKRSSTQV